MDYKKIVLAYSGGLDTSIIITWLKENYNNCEVIAVTGNVGQGDYELEGLEEKAKKTGASKLYILDLKEEMVNDYVAPAIKAGATYEGDYLLGTPFVLIGLGMNSFINSQGFAKIGMMTVLLGAVTNIILDPIFIFVLAMGVKGAALATVISQFVSALWTFQFLTGQKTILKLKKERLKLKIKHVKKIFALGMAGFMMGLTNSVVTIVCNATLQTYGGDFYIAIMTIINSIREVVSLPGQGLANASQPVLGYNYGAKQYQRVLKAIRFTTITCFLTSFLLWLSITLFPQFYIQIFSHNPEIITHGTQAIHLYFFGFFMMAFQMTGQAVAVGLGKSKQAVFFSLFRKVMIVVPLTLILPIYMGIDGVFIAEAISNFIGGGACYLTMMLTIGKDLKKKRLSVAKG